MPAAHERLGDGLWGGNAVAHEGGDRFPRAESPPPEGVRRRRTCRQGARPPPIGGWGGGLFRAGGKPVTQGCVGGGPCFHEEKAVAQGWRGDGLPREKKPAAQAWLGGGLCRATKKPSAPPTSGWAAGCLVRKNDGHPGWPDDGLPHEKTCPSPTRGWAAGFGGGRRMPSPIRGGDRYPRAESPPPKGVRRWRTCR